MINKKDVNNQVMTILVEVANSGNTDFNYLQVKYNEILNSFHTYFNARLQKKISARDKIIKGLL